MESYTDIISLLNYNIKYSIEFERLVTKREIDSITIEKYNQEYEKICNNNSLSEVSKNIYLSKLKSTYILDNHFIPFVKLAQYIIANKTSDAYKFLIQKDYITSTSYSQLYKLLIQLPQNEVYNILKHINLSSKIIDKVYSAIINKSKYKFTLTLEKEDYDLTKILRSFKEFYFTKCTFIISNEKKIDIEELENIIFKPLNDDINDAMNRIIYSLLVYQYKQSLNLINEFPNYSNKIENLIYERKINPNIFMDLLEEIFKTCYYNIHLQLKDLEIDEYEIQHMRKILYSDESFSKIVESAKKSAEKMNAKETKEKCNDNDIDIEFSIPDDFFSNKLYTKGSKENEWIFSIYLSPTTENKKKIQALQTFINNIAGYGYIEDNFNTKATFLYRMTGRKLPNTKPKIITWKDEMKNYNCFCYLIKNFENDFLNILGRNTEKGLYEKAQIFFGITHKIENPSDKANNTRKAKFIVYYELFKKDMK